MRRIEFRGHGMEEVEQPHSSYAATGGGLVGLEKRESFCDIIGAVPIIWQVMWLLRKKGNQT